MGIIFNFKCLRKRELISSGFIIGHYWIECFGKVLKQFHNTFLTKHVIFLLDFFPQKSVYYLRFSCVLVPRCTYYSHVIHYLYIYYFMSLLF